MSTLEGRSESALLVIDVQNEVVNGAHLRDEVVANIASLVEKARAENVRVVWVQHNDDGLPVGTPGWEYVPELERLENEALVAKNYGDSFEATDLEAILADGHIGRLVIVGAETDACIRSTLHGAFVRGYDVTLVGDAHTATDKSEWGAPPVPDVIAHTNLYWQFQAAPGRKAAVVETANVDFA